MKRLFEGAGHAKVYSQYRPTYPSEVYETIVKFCEQGGLAMDMAVDVACGTGQSTLPLRGYFTRVIGTDISQAQIDQVPPDVAPNVSFLSTPGEDLSFLDSGSVDLVTCAQGTHWLDRPAFYREVERVLKPEGVLALYGYGNCQLDITAANNVVSKFYSETLQGFWDPLRCHIEDHYAAIESTLPFQEKVRDDSRRIVQVMKVSQFIGYLSSWSAYVALKEKQPETDVLDQVSHSLVAIYQGAGENAIDPKVKVTWPVFILMARMLQKSR